MELVGLLYSSNMERIRFYLKYVVYAVLLLSGMSACSKSEEELLPLTFSVSELSFTSSGSVQRFDIRTASDWTLTAPDWVTCSPEQGSGTTTVSVTVQSNPGAERSGTIEVTAGGASASVGIRQESIDFSLSQSEIVFDSEGTPIRLTLVAKYPWSVEIPQKASWLTVSPSSGEAGETVVTFTPRPVDTREPRTKQLITFDYGVSNIFLIVSQTLPNQVPMAPQLLSPADGSADVAVNEFFSWEAATDPDGDELTYELQVSPDGGVSWPYTVTTTSTSAKLDQLLNKQFAYSWRVKASDPFGGETLSAMATFRTGDGGGYEDGEVIEWQHETAGASRPVHLVFTGDGFIAEDYVEGGAFEQAMQKAIDAIFSVEPYTTYRNYFRISAVVAHSKERGTTVLEDMGGLGPGVQTRNTVFGTTLDGGGSTGVNGNYNTVFSYTKKVPGIDDAELSNTVVFVLINVNAYAGTCHVWSKGRAIAYCPMGMMDNSGQPAYKSIIVHEGAGHGFGRLPDEYRYYDEPVDDYSREEFRQFRNQDPWYGWNISFTNDRNAVHWKQYFSMPGYEAVGLYEGAMLYTQGVWRPEKVSCMEDNRPYFNAPSREAIVRRIYRISGTNFDFNTFVSKDRIKNDNTARTAGIRGWRIPEKFIPLAPPVLRVDY